MWGGVTFSCFPSRIQPQRQRSVTIRRCNALKSSLQHLLPAGYSDCILQKAPVRIKLILFALLSHDDDATCKQVKGTVGQSGYDRFYKVYGSHRGGAKRCQLILAQCTCEVKDQVLGWTLRNLDNVVVELIRKFRIKPPFQSRSHNQYVCHARARQSASHVSAAALRVAASRCQAGQQQRVQAADQLSR